MADFKFKSPNVKTQEIDLSFASTPSLGITSVGMIGETLKGPAFEPRLITNKTEFRKIFGGTSTEKMNTDINGGRLKFLAPTYANAFLEEGNQLYMTRVLGLSGYKAGNGWAIIAGTGVDSATSAVTNTSTGSTTFTGTSYNNIDIISDGDYNDLPINFVKTGTIFTARTNYLVVSGYNASSAVTSGSVAYTTITYTAATNPKYEDMVVAVLRSRGNGSSFTTVNYNISSVTGTFTSTSGSPLSNFTLTAIGTSVNEVLQINLNVLSSNYIGNAIGRSNSDSKSNLYLEQVYPDLIRKLALENSIYEIKGIVKLDKDNGTFNEYSDKYLNAETPWIVSELNGNKLNRLFKFVSYSDGDSSNKEVKIAIENVNPANGEFDVTIRDYNDTDDNISRLEIFQRCNMNPESSNFIMRRIGGVYSNSEQDFLEDKKSEYVYVVVNIDAPVSSFPCGFEGYYLRNYSTLNTGTSDALTPVMVYKTSYRTSDKVSKTYLGISEKAFDTSSTKGLSINDDLFKYTGSANDDGIFTKTKGFHLDSGATASYSSSTSVSNSDPIIGEFEVGPAQIRDASSVLNGVYSDINKRKFVVVPYGGFDGWDIFGEERSFDDTYAQGGVNEVADSDYDAYKSAFDLYVDPELTPVNIITTPGINWDANTELVKEMLEIIEEGRQDALYIIDSPDYTGDLTSTDVAIAYSSLMDAADIDSSYAATYAPYIRRKDPDSNINVFIPPTGEILKMMALIDRTKFVWFAPAGIQRGGLPNAKKLRKSFKPEDRDTLYENRINPLIGYANNDPSVYVWGQKTLQVADSKLDRIDVRRLLLYAKQIISAEANKFLFEPNDDILASNFIFNTNQKLKIIKDNRGLRTFDVKLDNTLNTNETRDRNELYFVINLTPIGAVEFIGLTFVVNKTTGTITFND
jgi:hypothetical protein